MKTTALVLLALLSFNFNSKAQAVDSWSKETVLWTCKSDTTIQLTYRVYLCTHNGTHPSMVELNLNWRNDTVAINGTLSVLFTNNGGGSATISKSEKIYINGNLYSNQFIYNGVLNFNNISFDGTCVDPAKIRIKNKGDAMGKRG